LRGLLYRHHDLPLNAAHLFDMARSDVLVHAATLLILLALFGLLPGKKSRYALFVMAQLGALVAISLQIASFNFLRVTGSALDIQLIYFGLSNFEDNWKVMSSELPSWFVPALSSGALGALLLSWVVAFLMHERNAGLDGYRSAPSRGRRLAMLGVGILCALLTLPRPLTIKNAELVRHPSVQIALSLQEALRETLGASTVETSNTLNARLVARPGQRKRDVVIVLLESTAHNATSLAEDGHDTTPNLKALASERAINTRRAWAVLPHTSKAVATTLCGSSPHLTLPINEAQPSGIPGKCLPKLLSEQGWRTSFFQTATEVFENRAGLTLNMGVEDFFPKERMPPGEWEKVNYFGIEDMAMLEPAVSWAKQQRGAKQPFMMTLLTLTSHHDYTVPKGFERVLYDDKNKERDDYLNSLRYVDHFVGRLMERFKQEGLYEDTIFVFVGDHGEGFHEHGRSQHDNTIYEEGLHIPMFVHDPQLKETKLVNHNTSQLDVLPTVVDLLGFDVADASYPGTSLRTLHEDRMMRAHCWYERRCMASLLGEIKYIHHFDKLPDEVFDLGQDPKERRDLSAEPEQAELMAQRRRDLMGWRARVNSRWSAHLSRAAQRYITKERPEVVNPIDGQIGQFARLIGYKLEPAEGPYKRGDFVTLTYQFEVLNEIPAEWKLFVHGLDDRGKMLRNLDHVPVNGGHPLSKWKAGQFIQDPQRVRIPYNLTTDHFNVYVGIYHEKQGRAPITGSVKVSDQRALVVSIPVSR
jgi:arylsulfatase A-like enzyme